MKHFWVYCFARELNPGYHLALPLRRTSPPPSTTSSIPRGMIPPSPHGASYATALVVILIWDSDENGTFWKPNYCFWAKYVLEGQWTLMPARRLRAIPNMRWLGAPWIELTCLLWTLRLVYELNLSPLSLVGAMWKMLSFLLMTLWRLYVFLDPSSFQVWLVLGLEVVACPLGDL